MYKLVSSKFETLTVKRAEELIAMAYGAQFSGRFKPWHVDVIAGLIESGLFHEGNVAVATMGNESWSVNGNHTCHAVIKTKTPVRVVFQRFEVEDENDLALLFRNFDSSATGRSFKEVVAVESHVLGLTWPKRISELLLGAILLNNNVSAGGSKAGIIRSLPASRVEHLSAHTKEGSFLAEILNGKESRFMQKRPVAAAMLMTYAKNQGKSRSFWTQVRDGELLKKTDPQQRLRTFLMTHFSHSDMNAGAGNRRVKDKEFLVRSIHAWNAFVRGDTTDMKYFADSPIPKVLG